MSNENEITHKICAYGTLRQHQDNYWKITKKYGRDAYKFKTKIDIPGFNMYDLIYYPAAVKSDNPEDKIVVELYDCNYDAYWYIKNMENNAGYYEELVYVEDIPYSIFVMMIENINDRNALIDSGDWKKHVEDLCKFNC